MIAAVHNTIHYFKAPNNYFWQWAEDGKVIEWKNGSTICFTEDLVILMKALTNSGVPSFGSVLLVLAACNDNWKSSSECLAILHGLKNAIPKDDTGSDDDVMDYYINQAVKGMDMISSLPEHLRKGTKRAHLLHEVFKDCKYAIPENDLQSAVDELHSGKLDRYVLHDTYAISSQQYMQDLECLARIFHTFPYPAKLEQQLLTGLFQMPAPLPIVLPEAKPGDLLEELSKEIRTAGIANLARCIIAALNIPMHAHGSSDQLFGGVSDITNRGNYDRLLLSELAYDDTTLLARLANNEALYLRREQLPEHPKNKRILLIDTTIKMWGTPRLFATSAAIACTLNTKHHEEIETYMLKGSEVISTDSTTAKGVVQGLEILDPSLSCFDALGKYLSAVAMSDKTDIILVGRHEMLHDMHFHNLLADYPDALSFIINVSQKGEMHFNEVIKGRVKLLTTAKFDLEDILFQQRPIKSKVNQATDLPAFFEQASPLLFPVTRLRYTDKNCFYHKNIGVIAVTETFRLLYWPLKDKGAIELLQLVEQGDYSFGFDGVNKIFVLINTCNSAGVVLYALDVVNNFTERFRIEVDKKGLLYGVYHENFFYLRTNSSETSGIPVINCSNGVLEGNKQLNLCMPVFDAYTRRVANVFAANIKRHVNNGYSVLHQFKSISISVFNNISLDKKVFTIPGLNNNSITIRTFEHKSTKRAEKEEPYTLRSNKHCSLTNFVWADGSKAVVDSRGLIHMVSSDVSLCQVTLVLIEGKSTGCWSSDGIVAGNDYFIPLKQQTRISPTDFHKKYIEPIIQRINEG